MHIAKETLASEDAGYRFVQSARAKDDAVKEDVNRATQFHSVTSTFFNSAPVAEPGEPLGG